MKRRTFLNLSAAAGSATLFTPSIIKAQESFPSGPVQLIVPFDPGGGADRSFRLMAPFLANELGVPVNVVNIAGGGGWVAWQQTAQWDAEQHDHMLGTMNFPHVFSYLDPRMQRPETIDSFNLLAWHSLDPCVWCVRADEDRFTDFASFIEYVQANPGDIVISSTAVGSDDHMGVAFAEKFIDGFDVRTIFSNGDSQKIQELLGGVSDVIAANVGYMTSFVESGEMRWLTVLHPDRYELIPEVETFAEVTGEENVSFAGRSFVVANGLAEEKRAVYLEAIERVLNDPEYIAQEEAMNNNLMFLVGDEMNALIQDTREYVESVEFWEAEA
ncbi:Bug family tripartite tricarboxylate transporter substrate binding protein [Pelagibacterium montanilacus]|uniref:Bug family tripartite tricarboxylate transporter substrate binding protein n=1 Tax=Pelagibacterium montanilacus TaxID=2185280 RepID=UPI000F8F3EC8|nr:tripartite tricarboxylate transporter substrate binding protein [Pelagibacterium montanilacus]